MLGDWLAWFIKKLTFGFVRQSNKCGCGSRQLRLNRWSVWFQDWLETITRHGNPDDGRNG